MAHQATATARYGQNSSPISGLARFFPDATAMRMPVQLARVVEAAAADFSESTVIEFGTPREVLFACKTPLDFGDVLRPAGDIENPARQQDSQVPRLAPVAARPLTLGPQRAGQDPGRDEHPVQHALGP